MEETKPFGLEKHGFRNQTEPILQTILALLIQQYSNGRTELIVSPLNTTSKVLTIQFRLFLK